jgi:DNA-binding response OmpR family regulator
VTARPLVLVVEDDSDLRELLGAILSLMDLDVMSAANGLEGLSAIDRRTPALVLLDMRMPVMDGWEFARELDRRGMRPPIVVITAAPDPSEAAADIGAEGWLGKPFDLHELSAIVRRFIGDIHQDAPLH